MTYYIFDIESSADPSMARFLEPVTPPSNYKDPVKIADYIREATAEREAEMALDLDLAEIVALGLVTLEDAVKSEPAALAQRVHTRLNVPEVDMLALVTDVVERGDALVTFNGRTFDLPLLLRRYFYLGLRAPRLNLDRYRSPNVDLYEKLTNYGANKAHKLSWYAKRCGWPSLSALKGADIGAAVAEGRWSDVKAHCADDLKHTGLLAAGLRIGQ